MKREPERSTGGMLGSAETKPPRLALRTDRSGLTSRSDRSVERSGGPRANSRALPFMEAEAAAEQPTLPAIAPHAPPTPPSRGRRGVREGTRAGEKPRGGA